MPFRLEQGSGSELCFSLFPLKKLIILCLSICKLSLWTTACWLASPPDGHQHLLGSPPHLLPSLPVSAICRGRVPPAAVPDPRQGEDWGEGRRAWTCAGPAMGGEPNCPHEGTHLRQTADRHQPCVPCVLGCSGLPPP